MAAYFFASPIDVDIKLDGEEARKFVDMKGEKDKVIACPVYFDGESVAGQVRPHPVGCFSANLALQVSVRVRDGKKVTHDGIRIEFVGSIGMYFTRHPVVFLAVNPRSELFYDRGHHHEFLSLSQELAAPGEMRQAQTFDFNFKNVEKQFESYQGINVKLRFVLAEGLKYCLTYILLDIWYGYPSQDEWQKSTRRRTYGFTRSACRQTVTTLSKWKSVLRTACTSNSNTTSRSESLLSACICWYIYQVTQISS